MSRRNVLPVLLIVTLLSGVALGVSLREYLVAYIRGVVNVPGQSESCKTIERYFEVVINTSRGRTSLDLGELDLSKSTCILVKGYVTSVQGDLSLVMSGRLHLASRGREYTVLMPCLASINETCARIMVVISGYDEPLEVEPGIYRAVLELDWIAKGTGSFNLKLVLYHNTLCSKW